MPHSESQNPRSLLRYSRHTLESTYSESVISRWTESESTNFDSTCSLDTAESIISRSTDSESTDLDSTCSLPTAESIISRSTDSESTDLDSTCSLPTAESVHTIDSWHTSEPVHMASSRDTTEYLQTTRAAEENRRSWLSRAWQAFSETHRRPDGMEEPDNIPALPPPRLPDLRTAPPPPYSAFDAFIDQSPAERTWEERSAVYLAFDHYDGESLPEYNLRDPLKTPPSYMVATDYRAAKKRESSCSVWRKAVQRGTKKAAKAVGTRIKSKLYSESGELRCWRVFT
ncbi:hypothetical protein E6O75_ATG03339 [Venturia nashicola]|uniref:Uncharacterized protein n=1 Tax=Venturia nashicola TaxID=86259 RepID=A0A4Z1P4F0_9PEZI|nr:hypothetical protein E6O75_ATG03339 [Venturia nashicola]